MRNQNLIYWIFATLIFTGAINMHLLGYAKGVSKMVEFLEPAEINIQKSEQEVKTNRPIVKDWHDGVASYYDYALGHEDQRCTKDREPCYSQLNLTCASRDYPRGTMLHVATADNFIICRVNDFGPEEKTGRIIDLSSYAFSKLAPLRAGLIRVTVQEVK